MQTAKRVLDRGRRMRVHIGDVGPLPGVQAFECTGNLPLDRNSEYDSDEQILTIGQPEYTGALEVLDINSDLVFKGLMGKKIADPAVSDFLVENMNVAPVMLNVWNREKTKFVKSYLALGPTWTAAPFPTTVDGITTLRFEFSAVRGIKFPNHATGFSVINVGASPDTGPYTYNPGGARAVAQLSRKFQNTYVIAVLERLADAGSQTSEYLLQYLCVDPTGTDDTDVMLIDTPSANSQIIVYYAYTSVNEAGGYICQSI